MTETGEHMTMLETTYDRTQGAQQWRANCSCGFLGKWHIHPKWADRDATEHAKEAKARS